MKKDDPFRRQKEEDPLKEWIREGAETMDDPGFEDRVMAMVSELPSPVRQGNVSARELVQIPVVRRVGLAAAAAIVLVLLLSIGGLEVLLNAIQLVFDQSGWAVKITNTQWSEGVLYWVPIAILLWVFRLLDQTMATVRHRVQPGSLYQEN
ncbi:MAG: hypothetical protein WEA36_11055 [Balneolaceae bacterium]